MPPDVPPFEYREIDPSQIDAIRPLWEKLNAFHVRLSPHFAARRSARTFDGRKAQLLAKAASGKLRIDLVCAAPNGDPLGYCVTSLSSDGAGEIDSLFVEQDYRGSGIGTALMRRALAWLDENNATSKVLSVAFGNDRALAFYRQFGFEADSILLRHT